MLSGGFGPILRGVRIGPIAKPLTGEPKCTTVAVHVRRLKPCFSASKCPSKAETEAFFALYSHFINRLPWSDPVNARKRTSAFGAAHVSNRKRFGDDGPKRLVSLGQERLPETHETSDGGWGRNRTGVHGFAGRCITTLPPSRVKHRPPDAWKWRLKRRTPAAPGFAIFWSGKRDSNSRPQPW